MAKFYNNTQLVPEVDESNDKNIITVGNLHSKLFEKKSREVVDSEAYYSLETDSTLPGVKQVVTTITDADTQILLTDVNTQATPVDLTGLTGDGTEYLLYHDKVVHEEKYEESIYLPRSEVPEGSTTMSVQRLDELWGNVVVNPYTES